MAFQFRRESRPSAESTPGYQRVPSDYSETPFEANNRDSLPKYYPRDHEVTRWLVNQMRCRNGLHHLVNLANVQPTLLSAYFELFDQPHLYIDARTGPGMPAYGIKTVLYLTPLAIAIYFRLKSVLRLLLDSSGTRIHARARQEIDVNATCYVRRTKPRPGPFVMDEYSTTYPAIIAVRREFFAGLSLLMTANYHPQAPIGIVERLGTNREATHWFVDLLDFCVKLLSTRPGVDVIGLLQTISCRSFPDMIGANPVCFDPCVYDIRSLVAESERSANNEELWRSVFHRLVRKGASRSYSNCGNRLIGLLEHVAGAGFFRQKYMPKGPATYNTEFANRKPYGPISTNKMSPDSINSLSGPAREMAQVNIAIDRDSCLCLLTLWLERVRNRCLDRQAQRLFRLLTTSLAETELLHDFLFPPADVDPYTVVHPYWLAVGLSRMPNKQMMPNTQIMLPVDFLEDDANEICELEPAQVHEIRQEVGMLAHAIGIVDYSEKLYNIGFARTTETMRMGGDIAHYGQNACLTPSTSKAKMIEIHNPELAEEPDDAAAYGTPENRCASEDFDRKVIATRAGVDTGTTTKRLGTSSNHIFWSGANRNQSNSPVGPRTGKLCPSHVAELTNDENNKNNSLLTTQLVTDMTSVERTTSSPEIIVDKFPTTSTVPKIPPTKPIRLRRKNASKQEPLSRSGDRKSLGFKNTTPTLVNLVTSIKTSPSGQTSTPQSSWRGKTAEKTAVV